MKKSNLLFGLLLSLPLSIIAQNPISIIAPKYFINGGTLLNLPTGPSSFDYHGAIAQCSSNAFPDAQGELKFFAVDDKIYDREGYLIGDLTESSGSSFPLKGRAELAIVPDMDNCSRFFIIAVSRDYENSFAGDNFYFATLDFSQNSDVVGNNSRSGLLIVGNPFYEADGSRNGNAHMGISEPNADGDYKLVISVSEKIRIYNLDDNGPTFISEISTGGEYQIFDRTELEIVSPHGASFAYRIAVPFFKIVAVGSQIFEEHHVYKADLNAGGNLIAGSVIDLAYTVVVDENDDKVPFIHGLEYDPTGDYLFITHTIEPTFYPTGIDYFNFLTNSFTSITTAGNTDFQNSQIEFLNLFGVSAMYMMTDTKMGRIIGDDPTNFTLESNVLNQGVAPSYMSLDILFPSQDPSVYKTYLLPDQVDGYNYEDFYFENKPVQCCKDNTNYDKDTYTATTSSTWTASSNPLEIIVTDGDNITTIKTELRIPRGVVVTISNMELRFAPGARLVIEEGNSTLNGGRLNLTGGSLLTVDTRCGGFWQGVEVRGNSTLNQGTLSSSPTSNTSKQARFEMNTNSIIEHARFGVVNTEVLGTNYSAPGNFNLKKTGGIIRIVNARLRNNLYDVVMQKYFAPDGTNDKSVYTNSIFETTALLKENKDPEVHIALSSVKGISIGGNEFRNSVPNLYDLNQTGTGVNAFNSSFNAFARCLNPPLCTTLDPNVFENLTQGIFSFTSASALTFSCEQNEFINNTVGVVVLGTQLEKINKNNFKVAAHGDNQTAGIYLLKSSGYQVQENVITSVNTVPLASDIAFGIVVNNSGTQPNLIYKNTFDKLFIGGQSEGTNANITSNGISTGLLWKCNTFNNPVFTHDLTVINGSIDFNQGNTFPSNAITAQQRAANNSFSQNGEDPAIDHDFYLENAQPINYVYINGANLVPDSYTETFMTVQESLYMGSIPITYIPSVGCPTMLGRTKTQLQIENGTLNVGISTQLARIDAGSTSTLLAYVNSGLISTKVLGLQGASPYLSDEVLIAYLNRTPPSNHVQQIILANSPVSAVVKAVVDAMTLTSSVHTAINNAQTGLPSQRDKLYQEVAYLTNQKNLNTNEILRGILLDTTATATLSAALPILNAETDVFYKDLKVNVLIQLNDLPSATTAMNDIANFGRTFDLASILAQVRNEDDVADYLSQNGTVVSMLDNIISDNDLVSSGRAYALKSLVSNEIILPPFTLPSPFSAIGTNPSVGNATKVSEPKLMIVYPNPSNSMVTVDVVVKQDEELTFRVVDVTGQIRISNVVTQNTVSFSIADLKDGLYFGQLIDSKGAVKEIVQMVKK